MQRNDVAISRGEASYPSASPFHPSQRYPEYPFEDISAEPNHVYDTVRRTFRLLGLDKDRYGTPDWNPLSELIAPGSRVVLKPNFVLSRHYEGGDLFSIITHASVLRAVADYVMLALRGEGSVAIADAPQMDCDFAELRASSGLDTLSEFFASRRLDLDVLDLRNFWLDKPDSSQVLGSRHLLPGDPLGHVTVPLNERSAFCGVQNWNSFYGADYDRRETIRKHHGNVHEYDVSRTILSADVVISVPKLKVHKKVGVTLNAKGLVGTCTNKNCLVHYTLGLPRDGGDQFPDKALTSKDRLLNGVIRRCQDLLLSRQSRVTSAAYSTLARVYRKTIRRWTGGMSRDAQILDAGNWHGNDSAWRMVSDLMQIIHYARPDGTLASEPQRTLISVIDGIVGGEVNGPLTPDARAEGVIVSGTNYLAVDMAAAQLMGLDPQRLKWVDHLLDRGYCVQDSLKVITDIPEFEDILDPASPGLAFAPHPGWVDAFPECGKRSA